MFQYPMLRRGAVPDPQMLLRVEESLGALDTVLGRTRYAVGDEITVADYSLVGTVSTMEVSESLEL